MKKPFDLEIALPSGAVAYVTGTFETSPRVVSHRAGRDVEFLQTANDLLDISEVECFSGVASLDEVKQQAISKINENLVENGDPWDYI